MSMGRNWDARLSPQGNRQRGLVELICAYMDEAGNTGSNLDLTQPFHYVGALLIPETHWSQVRSDVRSLVTSLFGTTTAELHGREIFHGQGLWSEMSRTDRLKVFSDCVGIMEAYDLKTVIGRCDKAKLQKYTSPMHPHHISFWMCLEGIAKYLNHENSLGFIVADDCQACLKTLVRDALATYRHSGPPFGNPVDISSVIDTVHFMDSSDSLHMQLFDVGLFALQRLDVRKDDMDGIGTRMRARTWFRKTFPY
ncbi:MAG: DUF3800 domain-containing protein [Bacillota bacterium]